MKGFAPVTTVHLVLALVTAMFYVREQAAGAVES
jgi:hypothetical protein